jgi:hypothetical protein
MAKISSPKQFRGEVKRRGDALYLILRVKGDGGIKL